VCLHHSELNDHQQIVSLCLQGIAVLQELGTRATQARMWDSLGGVHHTLGHHAEAIACHRHAADLSRGVGDRYGEADYLTHLGDTHGATGNLDAARDAWQRALIILEELDHPGAAQLRTKLHHLGHPGPTASPAPDPSTGHPPGAEQPADGGAPAPGR
jgi:hypothetical protein